MFDRVFRDELLLVVVVVLLHHGRVVPAVHPHVFFMVKIWAAVRDVDDDLWLLIFRRYFRHQVSNRWNSVGLFRQIESHFCLRLLFFCSGQVGGALLAVAMSTLFLLLLCSGLVGDGGALLIVRDVRDVHAVHAVHAVHDVHVVCCFSVLV